VKLTNLKSTLMKMIHFKTNPLTICVVFMGALLMGHLTGCQVNPTKPAAVATVPPSKQQDPTSLLQKATQASPPEREDLMLQAAEIYLQRKDQERASRILNLLRQQNLSGVQLAIQQKLSLKLKQQLIQQQIDQTKADSSTTTAENMPGVIKIAVLLAKSGRFKPAADAIRQGILLAYYQQKQLGMTAELMFFDTADKQIATVYQQAVSAGANIIIGPLDKDQVKQLATMPSLTTPVLALNYLPESSPVTSPQLFQFGLATEDEARIISRRGQQLGFRRASLLYPQNEWGERSAAAFRQEWQQLGGVLVSENSYATQSSTDYAGPVRSLLGVHKTVGEDGKAKQARRQDIDFIVMFSDPKTARQLKPMLDYYFADNLPVFSTFNIFTTVADPGKDQDINGVQFTELPWLLEANDDLKRDYLHQPIATATKAETLRLVALGIDSFRLAPRLIWLQENTEHRIEGATGTLNMSTSRRIQRQSAWAQFMDGQPRAINTNNRPLNSNTRSKTDNELSNNPRLMRPSLAILHNQRRDPAQQINPPMTTVANNDEEDTADSDPTDVSEVNNSFDDINPDESSIDNEVLMPEAASEEAPSEEVFQPALTEEQQTQMTPSENDIEENTHEETDNTTDTDTTLDESPLP
jgi:outer membrane PBP1 activator LpoA protein